MRFIGMPGQFNMYKSKFLGFSQWITIAIKRILILIIPTTFISFSCLIALSWTSCTALNRIAESKHPGFIPSFGESSHCFTIKHNVHAFFFLAYFLLFLSAIWKDFTVVIFLFVFSILQYFLQIYWSFVTKFINISDCITDELLSSLLHDSFILSNFFSLKYTAFYINIATPMITSSFLLGV